MKHTVPSRKGYYILLAPVFLFFYKPVNGQDSSYYYYFEKKVTLRPLLQYIFVTFDSTFSPQENSALVKKIPGLAAPKKEDIHRAIRAIRFPIESEKKNTLQAVYSVITALKKHPTVLAAHPAFTVGDDTVYVGNSVIFQIKKNSDERRVQKLLEQFKANITERIPQGHEQEQLVVEIHSAEMSAISLANALQENGLAEFAQPNFTYRLRHDDKINDTQKDMKESNGKTGFQSPSVTPNDSLYSLQWFLQNTGQATSNPPVYGTPGADIEAYDAWGVTQGNDTIVVAVIELGGFDLSHPELTGKIIAPYNAVDNNNNPSPTDSSDNHGTPCAGLVAALTNNKIGPASVGWNIKVMPIRFGYSSGFTDDLRMARAASKVILQNNVVAVSNSWGGGMPSSSLNASIRNMRLYTRNGKGAVILFAAGNDNASTVGYPANVANVIAVGASSMCDQRKNTSSCDGESSWGSNYGDSLDVMAPGVKILTLDRSGNPGYCYQSSGECLNNATSPVSLPQNYTYFNGTSSACPITAGVVGLIASANPNLTQFQLEKILRLTTEKPLNYQFSSKSGYCFGTWNPEMGYGRINAYAAIQAANLQNSVTVDSLTLSRRLFLVGQNITVYSAVTINNTGNLILLGSQSLRFQPGFRVKKGATLRVLMNAQLDNI